MDALRRGAQTVERHASLVLARSRPALKTNLTFLPALLALSALACRTDRPHEGTAQDTPRDSRTIAATPLIPLKSGAQDSSAEAVPAVPILPPKSGTAPVDAQKSGTRAERLSAIQAEHEQALDAYYDLFRKAQSDEERQKLAETTARPDVRALQARVRALLSEDATDMTAFQALKWLLRNSDGQDMLTRDVALLESHHFQRPEMTDVLASLQYSTDPACKLLLQNLATGSPHRNVRGRALMSQAEALKSEAELSATVRALPAGRDREEYVKFLGQAEFDRLAELDSKAGEERTIALYEQVVRAYADVPASRRGTIGDQAQAAIHELQNLVVGKTAPDISGEDIDGVAFKLSDYRGKVVLLDFWGHW
ncbi:MAG: redoxin domain-containing protein [Planctomycetes bacterium]|nr:redoxin domain-containing protein [Planctomycetota bacterium]